MVVSINAHQAGYLPRSVYHLREPSGRCRRLIGILAGRFHEPAVHLAV